jgi:hypothetical protein
MVIKSLLIPPRIKYGAGSYEGGKEQLKPMIIGFVQSFSPFEKGGVREGFF